MWHWNKNYVLRNKGQPAAAQKKWDCLDFPVGLPNLRGRKSGTSWVWKIMEVLQYCADSFTRNWKLRFLNQWKGENDHRKYFMIKSTRKNLADSVGVEPTTSWLPELDMHPIESLVLHHSWKYSFWCSFVKIIIYIKLTLKNSKILQFYTFTLSLLKETWLDRLSAIFTWEKIFLTSCMHDCTPNSF